METPFYKLRVIEILNGKTDQLYRIGNGDNVKVVPYTPLPNHEKTVGYVTLKFANVSEHFANPMGGVHGGALATWVDIVTSIAIFALDPHNRPTTVSVSLDMDYIGGAKPG